MGIILGILIFIGYVALVGFLSRLYSSSIEKAKIAAANNMTDERFCVMLPKAMLILGLVVVSFFVLFIFIFTVFQKNPFEVPSGPWGSVFFIVFGGFSLLGLYFVLKTAKFKVVVNGKKVTVYSIFIKPYTFTFDEIVSVKRQVSRNKLKSESLYIQTTLGKNLNVESAEISYDRFLRRIKSEVKSELLIGFDYDKDEYSMLKRNPAIIRNYVVESIKLLAGPPEMQLSAFYGRTDELAYALDGWLRVYENDSIFRRRYFSKYEYKLISDLNKSVNDLSADLFTENAIKTSPEWDEIRIQAKDVLSVLKTGQ